MCPFCSHSLHNVKDGGDRAALSELMKREGRAGKRKLAVPPILLVALPILMELPYVGHQMLNFILI